MYTALIILGIIVLIVVVLVLIAPRNYNVERSIVINRPVSEVFNYLRYIKNQDHWSPWKKRDPNMVQSFEGTDGAVGFISRWEGNKHVGTGEQEIIRINENREIISQLRFLKPWKSTSDAFLRVEEVPEGSRVTWGFYGNHKPPMNVMMMFFNMDKAVGKDFDEGLSDLKKILEQQ